MSAPVEEKQIVVSDEKQTKVSSEISKPSSLDSPRNTQSKHNIAEKDLDQAYVFLTEHSQGDDSIDLKALRRKIDWRIVPVMFLCYVMQFVDKVMINYANVMGLSKDLKLDTDKFSNVGSSFFIAYLVAEIPTGYILQKVGVAKWLGANVILWGIATACHAAAFNYSSLIAARVFLGIFEAAIAPCLMLISSQWYTKSEQAPRFSFWYCGLGVGQIFGGIVSFGFQKVKNPDVLTGWRIMYIFMGILTILIGIATYFILPDTPMKVKWLSDAEKRALLNHVSVNQTGIENKHFKFSQIIELFRDIQIWLLVLITILISISSGVISTYSATLIRGFGYSAPNAALLNMPGGIVSIASTLIVGFGVRKTSNRWAWLVACCIPGMIGGALMSFLPARNKAGLLIGIYLVNFIVATLPILYQYAVQNVAGHSKRTMASAIVASAFSVGNIVGPQTFRNKDRPHYYPAKITVLATQGGGALVTVLLFLYYVWANKKKDNREVTEGAENWENKTDMENKSFRYVY